MKFCKRLLLAATAASLTLLLSVVGNAQAQQSCQSRRIHLHLSDPQLQDELVCELIDDFTSRYSESLADKTIIVNPLVTNRSTSSSTGAWQKRWSACGSPELHTSWMSEHRMCSRSQLYSAAGVWGRLGCLYRCWRYSHWAGQGPLPPMSGAGLRLSGKGMGSYPIKWVHSSIYKTVNPPCENHTEG